MLGAFGAMRVRASFGPAGHGPCTRLHAGSDRPLLARTERADGAARMRMDRLSGRRLLRLEPRRRRGRCRRRQDRISARSRRRHRDRVGAGQEQLRVDIALRVWGLPDAEVDVRHRQLRNAARVDGADRIALPDRRPAPDRERAEVHERHRVPIRRLDRHRLARGRHGSGERNRAGRRREDGRPHRRADVDPAVLSRRVRVRTVERERRQDGPRHRPAPAQRRSRGGHGGHSGHDEKQTHGGRTPPLSVMQTTRP